MTGSATQGGIGHKNLDLSVYSESVAPNELGGNPSPNPYTDVGEEVAIFVSGAVSYSARSKDNTHVLFNGNLGTSGSMHFMNPATLVQARLKLNTGGNSNAAHGMASGQKITLTSTDGTTKTYVLVDPALSDSDTTATTHTPLAANSILGANATVTMPAAPAVGDVVTAKAGNLGASDTITINKGSADHRIDGLEGIVIESPFGAVTMVYVVANHWKIV